MVGDDRDRPFGDPRRGAVKRIGDSAAHRVGRHALETETGPEGAPRPDLAIDHIARVARQRPHFGDGLVGVAAEREREDEQAARVRADLEQLGNEDGDGGLEGIVIDPLDRPIASVTRRDRRVRNRSAFGDLGVVRSPESRIAGPFRQEPQRRLAGHDADHLDRSGPPVRRDRGDLDARVFAVVDREWERVFDEERLGVTLEEREPERGAVRRRQRRTVPAHRVLVPPRGLRERIGRGEPEPADLGIRHAEGNEPAAGRERSGDDAVAEVQRLVRLSRIERRHAAAGAGISAAP